MTAVVNKVPAGGSADEQLVMLIDWKDDSFDILLMQNQSAWLGSASNDHVKQLSQFVDMTVEDYINETKTALSTLGGLPQFSYHVADDQFVWKKVIQNNIKIRFGYVSLEETSYTESSGKVLDALMQQNCSLQVEVDGLQKANKRSSSGGYLPDDIKFSSLIKYKSFQEFSIEYVGTWYVGQGIHQCKKLGDILIISQPTTPAINSSVSFDNDYKTWSYEQTKVLIELYKKHRKDVGSMKLKNMKNLWELIALNMTKTYNLKVTPANCENRWRVMERNYKKYIDSMGKTGWERRKFDYADEMNEIFQMRRSIHPELLLSASSVEEIVTTPSKKKGPSENSSQFSQGLSKPPVQHNSNIGIDFEESVDGGSSQYRKRKMTDILEEIRKDRLRYQTERLKLQRFQYERKFEQMKKRNDLIEERNTLLKQLILRNENIPTDLL